MRCAAPLLKKLQTERSAMAANDHEYPATELQSAGLHSRGNSTGSFYKVEVRTSYHSPTVIGTGRDAFVIDHCWRYLPIVRGATQWGINIPMRQWDGDAADHGLFSYLVAEAHRWAFLAFLDAHQAAGALCIQTRLVEVQLIRSYDTKELGVGPVQIQDFHKRGEFEPRAGAAPGEGAESK